MRLKIFVLFTVLLAVSSKGHHEKFKKQAVQNGKSHVELEAITANKCKDNQWLRKGKCESLTGIGEKFPNFPEVVIQRLREKMRDDYWNWERLKVTPLFQKLLKKLKVRESCAPTIWSPLVHKLHWSPLVHKPHWSTSSCQDLNPNKN